MASFVKIREAVTGPHSPFVHDLLRHLEAAGFVGTPKLLRVDGRRRMTRFQIPLGADI